VTGGTRREMDLHGPLAGSRAAAHNRARGDSGTPMDATFSIRFSPYERDGLRAVVIGARTLANTIDYWKQIAVEAARLQPRRLLLDDALTGAELAPHEWQELVRAMTGCGLEQVRIAHIKRNGLGHLEYCEIYANAAGFDARAFTDEREAERWLRYGEGAGGVMQLPPGWAR